MDDPIAAVEKALEKTARKCLRLIVTRSITASQNRKLAKWMFGCLNQRSTIRHRVASRGNDEMRKVLQFIAKACDVLIEIDEATESP